MLGGCAENVKAPVWHTPGLDKCQKSIDKQASLLGKKLFTALQKCKDYYRTDVLAGKPLTTAGGKCEVQLDKVVSLASPKSSFSKVKAKLNGLVVDGTCSDTHLLALGHLPVATFNDTWSRLILLPHLKAAIESQILLVSDTLEVMTVLSGKGCTSCAGLTQSPCSPRLCTLAATSTLQISPVMSAPAAGAFSGTIPLDVCDAPDIFPNNFAVLASPARDAVTVDLGGGVAACVSIAGARGYITRAASAFPVVLADTCQDHIVNDPDSDECGGGYLCSSPQSDTLTPGVTNGGTCSAFAPFGPPLPGSSFVLAALRIKLMTAADVGPDGPPCTLDDTAPTPETAVIPLATGAAQALYYDLGAVDAVAGGIPRIGPVEGREPGY